MRIIIASLFCLACISALVSAYASEDIPELKGTLLFRDAVDSNLADYAEELLRLAYKDMGYKVKYVNVPLKRGLFEAVHGNLDGELLRIEGLSNTFPNLIAVPYKLFDFDVKLMVNERLCPACQLTQLSSVAYVRGIIAVESLLAETGMSNSSIGLATMDTLLDFFNLQRSQGMITAVHNVPIERLSKVDFSVQSISTLSVVHYLNIRHSELVLPLSQSLFNLERNGAAQKLREKYAVKAPEQHYPEPK